MTNENENEPRTMEVPFTERDYWAEVEDLAKQIAKEARETGNDRSDVAHETVDGHEWVIYTYKARFVLLYSSNEDAATDDMGRDAFDGCETLASIYERAAFFALLADVNEALADIPEDEDEDEDEDEEAASAEGGAE